MASFSSISCQQTRALRCPKAFSKARSATVVKAHQDAGANRLSSFLLAGAAAATLMTGCANAVSPNIIDNIKEFVDSDGPVRVGERMGERLESNPQIQELKDVVSVPRPAGGASTAEAEKTANPNPMSRAAEADFYKTGDKSAKGTVVDEVAKVEGPSTEERFSSGRAGGKGVKGVSLTAPAPVELFRLAAVTDLNEAKNYTGNEQETGQYVNNTDQKAPDTPTEGMQAGLPESLEVLENPVAFNGQGGFQLVFLNEENMYQLKDKDEEAAFYQTDKQARSDETNIVDKVADIEAPSTTGRFASDRPAGKGVEESPEKRLY